MAANKLIQQPDILNLDSLGAFMDAQNDPIGGVQEEKEVAKVESEASDVPSENEVHDEVREDNSTNPQETPSPIKPKPARVRKAKPAKAEPVIETGSNEWDMMVKYAEFYNFNPDVDRITVVLNPDIKRVLDIIRINCRQFNFGNILNAVCRTFIERNKEQIQRMQKNKGGIL